MKIDLHCQRQRCNPMTLVSDNIMFMRIFARVPRRCRRQTTVGLSKTSIFSFQSFRTLHLRSLKKCKKLSYRLETGRQQCIVDKLLSNAVMTYSYIYYLPSLRPANSLRTERINSSMRRQHVRMTHNPTVV